MRIAIVGSRDYPDRRAVEAFVAQLPADTIVISGGAPGVDTWADDAAHRRGLITVVFRADWDAHGRSAGFRRNVLIVDEADEVVAFWDGESRGTAHTIGIAHKHGKPVHVFQPPDAHAAHQQRDLF